MKKKLLILAMALAMIATAFTGCGSSAPTNEPSTGEKTPTNETSEKKIV